MLKKEVNYEFRSRLLEVHKKDIRDFSLTANADEYEIKELIIHDNMKDKCDKKRTP